MWELLCEHIRARCPCSDRVSGADRGALTETSNGRRDRGRVCRASVLLAARNTAPNGGERAAKTSEEGWRLEVGGWMGPLGLWAPPAVSWRFERAGGCDRREALAPCQWPRLFQLLADDIATGQPAHASPRIIAPQGPPAKRRPPASMSRSLHLRECTSRLPLLLPSRRATTSRHTYAQWQCRLRCNSAFSPASIAALLDAPSRQPVPSDETLTLNGFVRSVRKQKRVAFAAIGDGSSLQTVQVVLTPEQAAGSVDNTKLPTPSAHLLTPSPHQTLHRGCRGRHGPLEAVSWSRTDP